MIKEPFIRQNTLEFGRIDFCPISEVHQILTNKTISSKIILIW